jgi:acyl-CoA thioesterase FadM
MHASYFAPVPLRHVIHVRVEIKVLASKKLVIKFRSRNG